MHESSINTVLYRVRVACNFESVKVFSGKVSNGKKIFVGHRKLIYSSDPMIRQTLFDK